MNCIVIQQEPRDVTADVGTSVLFDCRVSGDPMPSITWKKRNQQMPVGRAYIAPDNRGLRIDRCIFGIISFACIYFSRFAEFCVMKINRR